MRFKIDWASLIVGRKFTFFTSFYFVFKGNFPSTIYYIGAILRRVFALQVWGACIWKRIIHGGAYFRNFMVTNGLT